MGRFRARRNPFFSFLQTRSQTGTIASIVDIDRDRQIKPFYTDSEIRAVVESQLEFYRRGRAGCLFAAHAALNPDRFGWKFSVLELEREQIEEAVQSAIALERVSTQSLVFPEVITVADLKNLLNVLAQTNCCTLGQQEIFDGAICLGYRMRVGELTSWVTGFGNFDFLPSTRRAPYTEITFRSKPRPDYKHVMKEAPAGVIHLADMDMQGMQRIQFQSLWDGSIRNTERVLGHQPDLKSAAKTTFAIPIELWQ